jgi:hypothetical protein
MRPHQQEQHHEGGSGHGNTNSPGRHGPGINLEADRHRLGWRWNGIKDG